MLPNRFVLGVLAGLIVSAVGLIFAVARKEQMVAVFMQPEPGGEGMSRGTATAMLSTSMGLFGPILGALAALVYGWVPSRTVFLGLALGLATLLSMAAVVSRTPMAGAKVVLNYLVALVFGLLLPRLTAG
jgi:hypothetical protein